MKNALKVTMPTDREIVMTREFNAPRALVFEAMTKPEFLKRWLFGPEGWAMTVCEEDTRVGGAFRWAWEGPAGAVIAMHGIYREVVPPERLVRTEVFDFGCGPAGREQVATMLLVEQDGKTRLIVTVLYPSKEARDETAASGMEKGVAAGYDRLDEILAAWSPR